MTLKSKASRFKSKFITAELASIFSQSDSEGEFEGFDEEEENDSSNKRLKTKPLDSEEGSDVDTGFYSDGDDVPPPKKKILLVALRFPIKRLSSPKQETLKKKDRKPVKELPLPQRVRGRRATKKKLEQQQKQRQEQQQLLQQQLQQWRQQKQQEKKLQQQQCRQQQRRRRQQKMTEEEEETDEDGEEVLPQSLKKRDKNIRENKAMLAKLFADLSPMADLTLPNTPQKKKRSSEKATPRKPRGASNMVEERRNPSRKARPPENFAVEEKEPVNIRAPRNVDINRLVEVDEEMLGQGKKKRRIYISRRSRFDYRPVDDITEEDLDNIAYSNKDKIWDKENGSSCHQCRQKTLDTKTVCRSGFCVGGKGQFCGPCLKNRYGEEVRKVLLDPTWSCPLCRGMCNCSLCRKKEGRCATGMLLGLARYNGHDNVHNYLESIQKELQ